MENSGFNSVQTLNFFILPIKTTLVIEAFYTEVL